MNKRSRAVLLEEYQNAFTAIAETQEYILQYLREHPCLDCGETNLACLQFDHVNGDKLFQISSFVYLKLDRFAVEREIAKCEVRCHNCHTKRHGIVAPAYLGEAHAVKTLKAQFKSRGYNIDALLAGQASHKGEL